MEFLTLQAENFCTLGNITLPLNQPGLVLVTGINKDAPKANNNGAGKSLLFDALCWCIWGETIRDLSGDEVVNDRVGKDCAVALTLEDSGDTYIISRHRKDTRTPKPNDLLVMKNGMPLLTKGKMKTMQEVVNRIVGFGFKTFCAMMPGTGVRASHMTDSQIKNLLESLLQTEQLSAAYESVRARLKELDSKLSVVSADRDRILAELKSLDSEVGQIKALRDSFEENKLKEIKHWEARIIELKAEIAEYDKALSSKSGMQQRLVEVRREVADSEAQISQRKKVEWDRSDAACGRIAELDRRVSYLRLQHDAVVKSLSSVQSLGPTCYKCQQSIPHEHTVALAAELESKKNKIEKDLRETELTSKSLQEADASYKKDATAEIRELDSLREIKAGAVNILWEALLKLEQQEKLKMRTEEDLVRIEGELDRAKSKTANFQELLDAKIQRTCFLAKEMSNNIQIYIKLESEKKLCSFWVDGFSPAGLRSFMLDYVTPILNDRAAYYSQLLTDDEMEVTFSTKTQLKKGETRDKFQILVKQKHGGSLYKATSTGEKARADLVISMALGDLAAFRTAKQLPWRFLDEPFESIDDAGTDAIIRLLNDQKARYKTVFVVTHKSAFKQMFSQRITVVKENGISRLENETT